MLKELICITAICFVSFGFQLRGCQQKDDRINVMSPEVRGEIVFFFKKETTDDEILHFQRTVTGIPDPDSNTGYSSLPGTMTSVRIIVNDYVGVSINFQPDATEVEKAFVKRRISESPLVFRVYENIVPNEIDDLPHTPDTNKKLGSDNSTKLPPRKPNVFNVKDPQATEKTVN